MCDVSVESSANAKSITKTLVIHPDDRSTDVLKTIYQPIASSATIITGGSYDKDDIRFLIMTHDRIFMMGHGDAKGLHGIGFGDWPECLRIVDESMVEVLRDKECMFIWCYASMFVEKHNLTGFCTGMFISEVPEAIYLELHATEEEIDLSNKLFSEAVADMIQGHTLKELHTHVVDKYELLSSTSEVAKYNSSRLRYIER